VSALLGSYKDFDMKWANLDTVRTRLQFVDGGVFLNASASPLRASVELARSASNLSAGVPRMRLIKVTIERGEAAHVTTMQITNRSIESAVTR
jgi:hypothetical protein